MKWNGKYLVFLSLLLALSVGSPVQVKASDFTTMCVSHADLELHMHYTIKITLDNYIIVVPANIGITDTCMRPVHTHNDSGYVHVELPTSYAGPLPTLGDFFDVWGQTFSDKEFQGQATNVYVFFNGGECNSGVREYTPSDMDVVEVVANSTLRSSVDQCPTSSTIITAVHPISSTAQPTFTASETQAPSSLPVMGYPIFIASILIVVLIQHKKW